MDTTDVQSALASLYQAQGRQDPYPAYDVIRAHGPAVRSGGGQWFVTSHDLVTHLLRHPDLRVPDPADYDVFWPEWRRDKAVSWVVQSMLRSNPPDHTRMRRAAAATFTARRVAGLREVISEQARALIEAMPARADFMTAFAYPLPIGVICALLGVPDGDRAWFRQRAEDLTNVLEPVSTDEEMQRASVAGADLEDYFTGLVADRQRNPQDDLTSALATAPDAEGSRRLTGAELLSNLVLLLVAGFETTTNLLGNGLQILLERPADAALLRGDARLAPGFVEEMLRYDSPVQLTSRLATAPISLDAAGVTDAGETVTLLLGAANRDPDRYADPHRFDPLRENIQPVSFGGGAHFCLGAPLARLEAQVAFPLLVTMLPHLDAAGTPVRRDRLVLRGYASLPVTAV